MMKRVYSGVLVLAVLVLSVALPQAWGYAGAEALKSFFKSYYQSVYNASDLQTYLSVECKYGSADKISKLKGAEAEMSKHPPEIILGFVKGMMVQPKELRVGNVEVHGSDATVSFSRFGHPEFTGTAFLRYEQRAWKVIETKHRVDSKDKHSKSSMTMSF
jgi:hypothetical protein